tara:strand:+ start:2865 stop:3605 length:741 start_codon:yes stop_codon:yes gene_type:complete
MGYNVLSGSTSVVNWEASGSFSGDGSQLENVVQFPTQNVAETRIPFYKTISSKDGLTANSAFYFDASDTSLHVPAMTSSVGIRLSSPQSSSLAGKGSYLGIDAGGNLVITASASGTGPENSLQFHIGGGDISGSSAIVFDSDVLTMNCGLVLNRRQITSVATASIDDYYIGVSASSPLTVQMLGADTLSSGQTIIIKDEGGNANVYNITIKASGSQTIDGVSSVFLESPYASINLYSNGTDKFFIY